MFALSPRFIRAVGPGATGVILILLATAWPARPAQLVSPGPLDPFCEIALKAHPRASDEAAQIASDAGSEDVQVNQGSREAAASITVLSQDADNRPVLPVVIEDPDSE